MNTKNYGYPKRVSMLAVNEVKMVDCKLVYLKSKAQKALISLRSQHGTQPPPVGGHDVQNSLSHKLIQLATLPQYYSSE